MSAYAQPSVSAILAARDAMQAALWIAAFGGGLLVAVIVGWLVLSWLRRRTLAASAEPSAEDKLWTLDGLRQLKRDGLITEQEYARLRARLLDALGASDKSGQAAVESPPAMEAGDPGPAEARPGPPDSPEGESGEPAGEQEHKNQGPSAGDGEPPQQA